MEDNYPVLHKSTLRRQTYRPMRLHSGQVSQWLRAPLGHLELLATTHLHRDNVRIRNRQRKILLLAHTRISFMAYMSARFAHPK